MLLRDLFSTTHIDILIPSFPYFRFSYNLELHQSFLLGTVPSGPGPRKPPCNAPTKMQRTYFYIRWHYVGTSFCISRVVYWLIFERRSGERGVKKKFWKLISVSISVFLGFFRLKIFLLCFARLKNIFISFLQERIFAFCEIYFVSLFSIIICLSIFFLQSLFTFYFALYWFESVLSNFHW